MTDQIKEATLQEISNIGQEIEMNTVKLAQEAGFMLVSGDAFDENAWFECFPDQIQRFAELVAAAERESCAKVCESPIATQYGKALANAIRARGESI